MSTRPWRLTGNVIHQGRGTIRPGDDLPDVSDARVDEWVGLGRAEWIAPEVEVEAEVEAEPDGDRNKPRGNAKGRAKGKSKPERG